MVWFGLNSGLLLLGKEEIDRPLVLIKFEE
jgi:hypothetical protein